MAHRTAPPAPGQTFGSSFPERFIRSALQASADNANRRSNPIPENRSQRFIAGRDALGHQVISPAQLLGS